MGFTIGLAILEQMAQRYIDDGSISKDEILTYIAVMPLMKWKLTISLI